MSFFLPFADCLLVLLYDGQHLCRSNDERLLGEMLAVLPSDNPASLIASKTAATRLSGRPSFGRARTERYSAKISALNREPGLLSLHASELGPLRNPDVEKAKMIRGHSYQ